MQTHYWGCRVQSPHDLWTQYEVEKPLANAEGGEGGIFTLKPHAGEKRVAKIYNAASKALLTPEAFHSLAFLTSKYAEYSEELPFVAWPIEVLFTVKHPSSIQHLPTLAGITMRHVSGHGVLEKLTTNGNGRFGIGTEKAVRIAAVIANHTARLHKHGIVFCDFNPKNILVSNDHSTVTFVDADAFQHSIIPNVFTKPHFFPGYASPDHITAKPGPRQPADDNFVLAIHIFQLLLDGGHPFDTGPAFNPTGDPFASICPNDNIKARRWPYEDVAKYHPPGETPKHYARLHPDLRAMFERAFLAFSPPTAAEWDAILPRFRDNVEATTAPPVQMPPKAPAVKPKPAQPKTPVPPTPHNTPYSYHAIIGTPAPTPTTPPAPPTPAKLTAKSIAKAAAWWLADLLWRFVKFIMRWLWKQVRSLAIAAGRGFRKHGGFEIAAGLIFLTALFSFFEAYETYKKPTQPPISERLVKTTAEPHPQHIAAPNDAKRKPPPLQQKKKDPEPEILPWRTQESPAP